jgi:aspartyl-tRNA(Asn)/glutamyl-tRNA(Gln) amidotransferase subunit C
MPRIHAEEVHQIATLARLRLSPEEALRLCREIEDILGYVEMVSGLDTGDAEPLTHAVGFACPTREDVPGTSLSVEDALRNAPARHERFFEVPSIVPGKSGGG